MARALPAGRGGARRAPARRDLLRAPLLGRFLRWRHARTAAQTVTTLLAALILYDGFFGPPLAPLNLAGVIPWVHWRGLVVLALLVAGNLFCFACPFMLPRRLAKRLLPAGRAWPRRLRNKWLALALLALFFWAYEAFDLWASPWLTAWVIAAYFAGAFVVDGVFKGAAFCKYVCPIGQFNFINGLVSPLEVRVREPDICARCTTKDCIAGRPAPPAPVGSPRLIPLARRAPGGGTLPLAQQGCELWLFQERKVGNADCTFCLDCVQACPHQNVGILARLPTKELWTDPVRSGVGRLSERPDLAALSLVVVFGAFINAFGMVAPVYALQRRLADLLGIRAEAVIVGLVFGVGLFALPALLVGLAAAASRALAAEGGPLLRNALRYSFALIPLGFGMWLAHYSFHLVTGGLTLIPVAQSFVADLGVPLFGPPRWELAALIPPTWRWLTPLEAVLLELGLAGTLLTLDRIAHRHHAADGRAWRAATPWMLLAVLLFAAGLWLMMQPMAMRGAALGG